MHYRQYASLRQCVCVYVLNPNDGTFLMQTAKHGSAGTLHLWLSIGSCNFGLTPDCEISPTVWETFGGTHKCK